MRRRTPKTQNIGLSHIGSNIRTYAPTVSVSALLANSAPQVTIKALLTLEDAGDEGQLVMAVAVPWFEIARMIQQDPQSMYGIDHRAWEEIIAGAYTRAGFDNVVLTPRSGDFGRDVIATKLGTGSIRIYDQVKAYSPGHVVTAEEVRAMLGVITAHQNVSKGVITTTSTFAPRLMDDADLARNIPYRLELKPRDVLLPWLDELSGGEGAGSA
jgi:restriction system protein